MLAPCPHYTIPPPSCQAFFALVSRPADKALQRPQRAVHKPGTQSSRREPHPPPAPWGGGAPREDAAGQTRRAKLSGQKKKGQPNGQPFSRETLARPPSVQYYNTTTTKGCQHFFTRPWPENSRVHHAAPRARLHPHTIRAARRTMRGAQRYRYHTRSTTQPVFFLAPNAA